jgi:hypothetical protein
MMWAWCMNRSTAVVENVGGQQFVEPAGWTLDEIATQRRS